MRLPQQHQQGLILLILLVLSNFVTCTNAFVPPQRRTSAPLSSLSMRHGDNGRRRKRDVIRQWGSSSRLSIQNRFRPLAASKNDNDDENNNKFKLDTITETWESFTTKWETTVQSIQTNLDKITDKLPQPIVQFVQVLLNKLASWKNVFVSFVAGAFLAGAVILVPIYSSIESLSQPVTLFETILSDLEMAYVDEVDSQKLFETGISAMLRSLDPYTEFEGPQEASALTESIDGKYGGVGLVIAGNPASKSGASSNNNKLLPKEAQEDKIQLQNGDISSSTSGTIVDDDNDDPEELAKRQEQERAMIKAEKQGIRVITAFEGYAFDYGMRVGDKLVAVDNVDITSATTVEDVRNALRGEPGTMVTISFERDGVDGRQTVSMPRSVVQLRDVKLATLLGKPQDGIGYIQLSGFTADAGREMRNAIHYLQQATEDANNGEKSLQGLVLDLRGNPGGLLTSAVDVASLLVPKGSDIVSAKGRGFPGILYRSRVDPILDSSTKLAVLVNGNTASAAEIVSGAVQDLDVGVIVGSDRTFGKGLVQNVEELPFNTALKFTVAKYYTPSGRCIQGVNYKEGGGLNAEDGKYTASKVADKDRSTFYTRMGRVVKDGGGIEADYKVEAPKASALEVTLLRSGILNEFAAEWSKKHELTQKFEVDEDTYKSFQAFVQEKQKSGDISLEALYSRPLADLKKALKQSGYKGSQRELEELQASIVREVQKDFDKYRSDIKEDIGQSILARYLPESMLIERGVKSDKQVQAAVKLIASDNKFEKLLAKGSSAERLDGVNSLNVASSSAKDEEGGVRATLKW